MEIFGLDPFLRGERTPATLSESTEIAMLEESDHFEKKKLMGTV